MTPAKHSGKSAEQLRKDSERDFFLSADEAKDYGLIDQVMAPAVEQAVFTGADSLVATIHGNIQIYG